MPPDAAAGPAAADRRHALSAHLTAVCARAQVLQRRVARMEGIADRDRERLAVGLAAIPASARAIGAALARLPPPAGPPPPARSR
jgi:hypothetical protein